MLWTTLIPVGCLWLTQKLDKEAMIFPSRAGWGRIAAICAAAGLWLRQSPAFPAVRGNHLLGIVLGCLLFASITDFYMGKAYRFVWWIGMSAGFWMLWRGQMQGCDLAALLLSLAVYALLQEIFFAGFYGRADCHAFCLCALAQAGLGMGMTAFWAHMTLSFALLAIVQGCCCNIGKHGRLNMPVPFLPYITAAFLIILTCRFPNTPILWLFVQK